MHCSFQRQALAALYFTMGAVSSALAVPYASGVRDIGGDMWEFVLNEDADEVTVLRDGGDPLSLGTTAGRLTFDMNGFSDFEIQVSKSAATGWTEIGPTGNLFADFEQPAGLAVNTIPSSPYFGTIYVNNSRDLATVSGRTLGDGIYALTADFTGVDLSTFNAVADPNDTSQAKAPGWTVAGSRNSAFRLALDEAGNVIASDWSDANGGVKYATADLTTGGLILNTESGPSGGVDSSVSDEFGLIPLHGSIVSKPIVTGTVGVDLTLWALDEDLDRDLSVPGDDGNSLWRWDVGSETSYTINPTLVVNAGAIPQTTDGRTNFFDLNIGVVAEAHFSPQHNKWYFTQPRDNGSEASLIVLSADGVDGNSPTLEWSSLQFSIDNNLDGFTDVPSFGGSTGIQDIFREAWAIDISDDGTKMFVYRSALYGPDVPIVDEMGNETGDFNDNPYLGTGSNLPGAVLVIPLDENGLPDIQIDDNGTPGDTSDDFLANVESFGIDTSGNLDRVNIDFDAAGNAYVTNNVTERLQAFSPGGNFTAVTGSDGTFELVPFEPPMGLIGDYNNDGEVDAADYTVWRDNVGAETLPFNRDPDIVGVVGEEDYDAWVANFGVTIGSGLGAVVPEPSAIGLALATALVLGGVIAVRRS